MDQFLEELEEPEELQIGLVSKVDKEASAIVLSHDDASKVLEAPTKATTRVQSKVTMSGLSVPYSDKFLNSIARVLNKEPDIALEMFKGDQLTLPPNPNIPDAPKNMITGILDKIYKRYIKDSKDPSKVSVRKSKAYVLKDMNLTDVPDDLKWFYTYIKGLYPSNPILTVPPKDIYIHLLHIAIQLVEIDSTEIAEVTLITKAKEELN